MVWIFNPGKKIGRSPKLQSKWDTKPWMITEIMNPITIQLSNKEGKTKLAHRNVIKRVGDQIPWQRWFQEEEEVTRVEGSEPHY